MVSPEYELRRDFKSIDSEIWNACRDFIGEEKSLNGAV